MATGSAQPSRSEPRTARQAWGDLLQSVRSIGVFLGEETHRHPWRAVGLAFGLGYLGGGGLLTRPSARLLGTGVRIGLRLAVLPAVRREIAALFADRDKTAPRPQG